MYFKGKRLLDSLSLLQATLEQGLAQAQSNTLTYSIMTPEVASKLLASHATFLSGEDTVTHVCCVESNSPREDEYSIQQFNNHW